MLRLVRLGNVNGLINQMRLMSKRTNMVPMRMVPMRMVPMRMLPMRMDPMRMVPMRMVHPRSLEKYGTRELLL